jgi:hypothetical protein
MHSRSDPSPAAVDEHGSAQSRVCDRCGESEPDLRRCQACGQVWYCSKKCQTSEWPYHKFTCQPDKVTTADRLALAVRKDLVPEHPQTYEDYGFSRVPLSVDGVPGPNMLFGLYVGLLRYLDVSPAQLHKWRIRGVLVDEIKRAYESIPAGSRGLYYLWFLEHQGILDNRTSTSDAMAWIDECYARGWHYIGGAASSSPQEIRTAVEAMSKDDGYCFKTVSSLLCNTHPPPSLETWVKFGFCVCDHQYQENRLGQAYKELIERCTFREFCTAYSTSTLVNLFERKAVPVEFKHFRSVMAGSPNGSIASVWWLKAFVVDETKDMAARPTRSVDWDYGYAFCTTQEQRDALSDIYKRFFEASGDPMELHTACLQGSTGALYTHVTSRVQVKNKKTAEMLKGVMRNVYPLKEH